MIHRARPVLCCEPGVPYCCSHFPLCTHLLDWSSLSAASLLIMKHFLPASQSAFSSATQTSAGCAHAPGCMLTPRCHTVLAGTDITYDQSPRRKPGSSLLLLRCLQTPSNSTAVVHNSPSQECWCQASPGNALSKEYKLLTDSPKDVLR